MSLKQLCKKNIISQILNLPPLLKEEILKESILEIKKQIKQEVIKEIINDCEIVVNQVTDDIINNESHWYRKSYTSHIDDDLYQSYVNTAQHFINQTNNRIIENYNL
tara:strand:+ start:21 stop:341 length:321 start_codon:yes stop_codon:yes gene_type:complete